MNHIRNFLDGFASVLDFNLRAGRSYVPCSNGFALDQRHLRGDVASIGADLRKGVAKYGKSSSGAGNKQAR